MDGRHLPLNIERMFANWTIDPRMCIIVVLFADCFGLFATVLYFGGSRAPVEARGNRLRLAATGRGRRIRELRSAD